MLPREQWGKRGSSPQLHKGQRKRLSPLQLSGCKGNWYFQDCIDSVNAALAQLIWSVSGLVILARLAGQERGSPRRGAEELPRLHRAGKPQRTAVEVARSRM